MNKFKQYFPIFENNPKLHYLDNAATTLKPQMVLDKMSEYYTDYTANIHRGVYKNSERATEEYENVRKIVADFIGGKPEEIIFTSGTTASLNLAASGWGGGCLEKGDEIVVTEMEHHSNLVPWQQLAKRTGVKLKFIPVDKNTFELDLTNLDEIITDKTKVLAITHVSNVTGTVNPVKRIIVNAKAINANIKVVVDGAQAVAHMPVSVGDLDADFYAFSGHKIYGPTGVGVLWGKSELLEIMDPINFGGGMIREVTKDESSWAPVPERFEAGTPPIAEVIGLGEAIKFVKEIGFEAINEVESATYDYLIKKLGELPGVSKISGGKNIVAITMDGVHPHDVATILDRFNVCVRSGHHCAMPLHQTLGLDSTLRISLGIYNDVEDVDELIKGLKEAWTIFTRK